MPHLSGAIRGKGSSTLAPVIDRAMKDFGVIYPRVTATYLSEHSSAAPAALEAGEADLGPMSRLMRPEEEAAIERKHGARAMQIAVALDCLAVFVHHENPVRGLTIPQLDCIFSSTRKCGYAEVRTWGQLGLAGDPNWASRPLNVYGRGSTSGSHTHFQERALFEGRFHDRVREQTDEAAVVRAVASDSMGIGYASLAHGRPGVRALPLSKAHTAPLAKPSIENALTGAYPLGRGILIYWVDKPGEPLPAAVREFFKFLLSRRGQAIIAEQGFGPLPADAIGAELAKVR